MAESGPKQWCGSDGATGVKLVTMGEGGVDEPTFVRYAHKRFRQAVARWRQLGTGPVTIVRQYLEKDRGTATTSSATEGWEKCYDSAKNEWFWRNRKTRSRRPIEQQHSAKHNELRRSSTVVTGHAKVNSEDSNFQKNKTNDASSTTLPKHSTQLRETVIRERQRSRNTEDTIERAVKHLPSEWDNTPKPLNSKSAAPDNPEMRKRRAQMAAAAAARRIQAPRVKVVVADDSKPKPAPPPASLRRKRQTKANSAAVAALARKNKDMSQTIREGKGPKPKAPAAPPKTSAASRSIFSAPKSKLPRPPDHFDEAGSSRSAPLAVRRPGMPQQKPSHILPPKNAGQTSDNLKRAKLLAAAKARAEANARMEREKQDIYQKKDFSGSSNYSDQVF